MDTKIQTTGKLEFKHFVVATVDGTIFGSARDAKNRVHNFLITRYGDVKYQVNGHFEPITSDDRATYIREQAELYYSTVPTYKIRTMDLS